MLNFFIFATTVFVNADESGTREAVVRDASRNTISTMRAMMCGRVSPQHSLVIGVTVGNQRDDLELWLTERLFEETRGLVATPNMSTGRLWGAAETEDFDFRVFDDVEAALGGLVRTHWQELLAAYPKSRIVLVLSSEHYDVNEDQKRRLEACSVSREDEATITARIAQYGSACPSSLQIAKYEDIMVNEIIENAPALQILDARTNNRDELASALEVGRNLTGTNTRWSPDLSRLIKRQSEHDLIVCPGAGATATKSLSKGLRKVGVANVDHNRLTQRALELASEDDRFDWVESFDEFGAVVDTPIPGYYLELLTAFPNAKVVLTIRDQTRRSYASRFESRYLGITQELWTAERHARGRSREVRRRLFNVNATSSSGAIPSDEYECQRKLECRESCARQLNQYGSKLTKVLSLWGDRHCRVAHLPTRFDLVQDFLRAPANLLLHPPSKSHENASHHRHLLQHHKGRLSYYGTICPSLMTALKVVNNNNRHVLRRANPDRLLVMDITKGDGYDLLCPFIGVLPEEECPRGRFPNSKDPKKNHHVSTEQQRRLLDTDDTCLCDQARAAIDDGNLENVSFEWNT